jgi:hypothetical protein
MGPCTPFRTHIDLFAMEPSLQEVADIAQEAGAARTKLRQAPPSVGSADAVILIAAQRAGARIVSADPAFAEVPGSSVDDAGPRSDMSPGELVPPLTPFEVDHST